VAADDGRLDLILAGPPAGQGLFEAPAGEADLGLVPAGAVLVLPRVTRSPVVQPYRLLRAVEQHEGEQAPWLPVLG
jgi:hypothetical protein